jgi:hypothetical protein
VFLPGERTQATARFYVIVPFPERMTYHVIEYGPDVAVEFSKQVCSIFPRENAFQPFSEMHYSGAQSNVTFSVSLSVQFLEPF